MRVKILLGGLVGAIASFTCLSQSFSAPKTSAPPQLTPAPNPNFRDPKVLYEISQFKTCTESLPILGRGIAEIIQQENLEQMSASADLIVVGQPLTELGTETTLRPVQATKRYDFFRLPVNQSLVVKDQYGVTEQWTLTSFKIQQVLKGKPTASKIQILEQGIVISGKTIAKHISSIDSDVYTPLRKGKKYLLFLRKTWSTPTSFFDPKITYTSFLYQGKFNLDGGDCPEAIFAQKNLHHRKLLREAKARYPKLFAN